MDTENNERRFRELVEQSSDWIWEVDENGRYTYASPKVMDILGYEPGDVIGKTPFDFMPPEEAERLSKIFSDLIRERKPFDNLENVNVTREGRHVVLESSGVPFFDSGKEFRGYRGMDRDISARKQIEERLRRTGESLAEAQRLAHLGSWDWDVEENRLSWSIEMCRIFGVDPGHFGASFEAFLAAVHPEDGEKVKKAVEEAFQGRRYDIEFRVVRPNGDERIVHARGEVAFGENRKPSRMFGTVLDITERKKTENELRLFRTLIDNSSDAFEVLDRASFRFLDMNLTGCRVLGYSREEIVGMGLWQVDPQFDQGKMIEIGELIRKNGGAVFEGRHKRRDGSFFPVEVSVREIELDRAYVLTVVRDISERKKIEEELRRSNEELLRIATTDMLTGIANRRKFYEILDGEISKAKRHATLFSLIMYDLDHFKRVNDQFGHDRGDMVLKTVTGIVGRNIRKEDMHARWGGEEFMILTPAIGAKAAIVLAEKLRLKVASHGFGPVGKVTVSFGVTEFEAGDDSASLARKVDEALYLAKEKGRNRVESV